MLRRVSRQFLQILNELRVSTFFNRFVNPVKKAFLHRNIYVIYQIEQYHQLNLF